MEVGEPCYFACAFVNEWQRFIVKVFEFGFESATGIVAKLLQTRGEVLKVRRVNLQA